MNPIGSNPDYAVQIQQAKAAGLLPKGMPVNRKAWETAIEKYGQNIAAQGGVGLAPQIYREMLRHQELSAHASQSSGL